MIDVFTNNTYGYSVFRIPGIVSTRKGTLLAYAEARKVGSDWAPMDIVLRRSDDGGETWGTIHVIASGATEGKTMNNPVMISEKDGDVIHFIYCENYRKAFYMKSEDEGLSWSPVTEITNAFHEFSAREQGGYPWKVIATGPGHGIKVKTGRLLVPIWMANGKDAHAHDPSVVSVIYSDDQGLSWHGGEIIYNTTTMKDPNESQVVELSNGKIMLNIRSTSLSKNRTISYSEDGISAWSLPYFDETLIDPVCMGSITKYSDGILIFSNLKSTQERENLTIRISEDDGLTWKYSTQICKGPAAYSDLTVDKDKNIYCLFERDDYKYLTLAKYKLHQLMNH